MEKSDTDNKTSIVYDNRLKLCIMRMPIELKNGLKSKDYLTIERTQEKIREYFISHQNEFNNARKLTNAYNFCPDYYALLCATTADLSNCESWDDIYKQFKDSPETKERLNTFTLCDYDDTKEIKKITCMCSHICAPENMSIITNKYTGLNNLIACDCLEKTGIITAYKFKQKVKHNDKYAKIMIAKEEKKKKKEMINDIWCQIVNKYLYVNDKNRRCEDCQNLSILKIEPAWKKICKECYIKKHNIIPKGVCHLLRKTLPH